MTDIDLKFYRGHPRIYDLVKPLGEGSFAEVYLVGWRSPRLLLQNGHHAPVSQMQINNNKPDYQNKHLVAIKRMKKSFKDWKECEKLKELKALLAIPQHPNLIPLYDAFLHPTSKELYFVFESMEGNLYQLTKSRRGRPLAQGLVASTFRQTIAGLSHIHNSGYFHRDMKPENLLITTTGLTDYPSLTSSNVERDVTVVVKLADFGLAREVDSKPPYTEYVSTRWYRAPEVLLRSRDYSAPVDLWALGTILAEIVNLKPLFPGQSEVDQVYKICQVLGNPTSQSPFDSVRNRVIGGGDWQQGLKLANLVGFQFPQMSPIPLENYFDNNRVPYQFIQLIEDLLKFDPKNRLNCQGCFESDYYNLICSKVDPSHPNYKLSSTINQTNGSSISIPQPIQHVDSIYHRKPPPLVIQHQSYKPSINSPLPPLASQHTPAEFSIASPSYSHSSAATSNNKHSSFCSDPSHKRYDSFASSSTNNSSLLYVNQIYTSRPSFDTFDEPGFDANSSNSTTRENHHIPSSISIASLDSSLNTQRLSLAADKRFENKTDHAKSPSMESIPQVPQPYQHKSSKASRWLGGVFGSHHNHQQLQQQQPIASTSMKADVSGSTSDEKPELLNPKDAKRAAKEAEKLRREEMLAAQRERARAVLNKQKSMGKEVVPETIKNAHPNMKQQARRPSQMPMHTTSINMNLPRSPQVIEPGSSPLSPTIPLHSRSRSGSRSHSEAGMKVSEDLTMTRSKARRRNDDDDHSMSSYSSLHLDPDSRSSVSLSRLSFGTEYSDPGPPNNNNHYYDGRLLRQSSQSSVRTSNSSPHLHSNSHTNSHISSTSHRRVYSNSNRQSHYRQNSNNLNNNNGALALNDNSNNTINEQLAAGIESTSIERSTLPNTINSPVINPIFKVEQDHDLPLPQDIQLPPFSTFADTADKGAYYYQKMHDSNNTFNTR